MPRDLPRETLAREHPAHEPRAVALEDLDEAHAERALLRLAHGLADGLEVVLALAELEREGAHVAEPQPLGLGDLEPAAADVERVGRRGPAIGPVRLVG